MTPASHAIRSLARDHRSGSHPLAMRACRILAACRKPCAASSEDFYLDVAQAVADAQPTMAAVWNVCDQWVRLVNGGSTPLQASRRIARALSTAQKAAVGHAAGLIRTGQVVMTYSASSSVEAALRLACRKGRRFRVLCAEGRPMYEGRLMAQRLAKLCVPVEIFTDAALLSSVSEANLVLVGCDAIFPNSFVNKVGTHALLRMARIAHVPAYVVADSFKVLPASEKPSFRIREQKPSEVWRQQTKNLRVRNFYFEAVPLRVVLSLITERGLCSPHCVPSLLQSLASGTMLQYPRKRRGSQ